MLKKLLGLLPYIGVNLTDNHLSVEVGKTAQLGFTVGPKFLSFNMYGDIRHQIISPPADYEAPLSDTTFDWNTKEGLTYLHFAATTFKANPFPWEQPGYMSDIEEEAPATQRRPTHIGVEPYAHIQDGQDEAVAH